ncbi:MAG: DNA topoisomerase IV subunit B, partial [Euryarchaeota archaeon]|nr:DNA topoisomerase IV subunit B [Euryarchaeota archaeon]
LYQIKSGKEIRYAFSDDERDRIVAEFAKRKPAVATKGKSKEKEPEASAEAPLEEAGSEEGGEQKIKGVSIQRYKGLGEMNPEQLWETTMNPEHRMLRRITIDDAEIANKLFDILMGNDVEPRKKFIQTHAATVKNLDI